MTSAHDTPFLVSYAMSNTVLTVAPGITVQGACEQMSEASVGSVIVCAGTRVVEILRSGIW